MVVQHCAVHSTQSVNTGGALAANKSARAMLGASRHRTAARVRAPTPGRRQSPFQWCLLCRTRAWAIGCAPPRQPRTATCDLSADAPHQATACNSHGTAAAMRAAAESPIPSRPPDARELFPTRVSVEPSGLSPPPALSTLRGGSRCGVRVRRASCGASPIAPGASATPRSLPRPGLGDNSEVFLVSAQTPLETQIKSRALQTAF